MLVKVAFSSVKQARWYECVIRFMLGGLITAAAGVIAKQWGAAVGGLFLAFPAIFPGTATLVQKHEKERKEQHGIHGEKRAVDVAAAAATGTAMGSVAMVAFALTYWQLITRLTLVFTLLLALFFWALVAGAFWLARKKINLSRRLKQFSHSPTT